MNTNITHALENKFSTELKFESVDIWIDDEGYALAPHIDNGKIKLALQIYLGDNNVGTSLYINDETVKTFEYTFNETGEITFSALPYTTYFKKGTVIVE